MATNEYLHQITSESEHNPNTLSETIKQRELEIDTLIGSARAILGIEDFEQSARHIFDYACQATGATSGYVALLTPEGEENDVIFLESGGLPCTVDPNLPMPIRGLRANSYHSGKAVYHNDFMNSEWVHFLPEGHVFLQNVMFAPLNIDGKTVGIMGLANKDGNFTDQDARIAGTFGEHAAIALKNSRILADLKQARIKEQAANHAKSSFLARMSHDLRTPLNAMLGFSELLNLSSLTDEQASFTHNIRDSGKILLRLIDDILDLTRIEADQLELVNEPFSPRKAIEESIQQFSWRYQQKGLELFSSVSQLVPNMLVGDACRLQQIINNLLSNALKFTNQGEVSLKFSAQLDEDKYRCRLVVQDTGQGIPAERIEELFSPFVQQHANDSRLDHGSGLGLAIVQGLAQRMGGNVEVKSKKGEGSTFIINILLKQLVTHKDAVQVEQTKTSSTTIAQGIRVLVAEDNIPNQMVLKSMIKNLGHFCVMANNGTEALEHIQKDKFDLVFMDCNMPIMDGFEAAKQIRTQGIRLPIIALTAYAMPGDRERCLAAGMNDYLAKPITMQRLAAMLANYISQN